MALGFPKSFVRPFTLVFLVSAEQFWSLTATTGPAGGLQPNTALSHLFEEHSPYRPLNTKWTFPMTILWMAEAISRDIPRGPSSKMSYMKWFVALAAFFRQRNPNSQVLILKLLRIQTMYN